MGYNKTTHVKKRISMGRRFRMFSLRGLFQVLGLLFLAVLWILILFNPVIFFIVYGNPLWLAMYLLIVPEFFVGVLISGLVFKLLDP